MISYLCRLAVLTALVPFVALSPAGAAEKTVPSTIPQMQLSFAPLVRQVAPSVVNIYAAKEIATQNPFLNDPFLAPFFQGGNMPRKRIESSLGSGVIVQADGLVVTNAHVVQGANEIVAIMADGREIPAKIQAVDTDADIALVQLDMKKVNGVLPTANLIPSDKLQVGDLVIAIGNPFGVGQTVTSGIVSAVARSAQSISDFNFFIQTDAAINPGNSGGPLVDMNGDVVGINTAIYSRDGGSLGIGFAVPAELVLTIINAKRTGHVNADTGVVARAWMGIGVQDVTKDIAKAMGIEAGQGSLVNSLHSDSPARDAGLKTGDIITALNGKAMRGPTELRYRMALVPIGQALTLSALRDGKSREITLQAIAPPETPKRDLYAPGQTTPLYGATLCNVNPAVEVQLKLTTQVEDNVAICTITRKGIAARFLRQGDIITAVNGLVVQTTAQIRKALQAGAGPRGWTITVLRNGKTQTVLIR
ncbi:MAG: trypsin-like peptidase domain-containing protein [Pseudomonadota bacterium]